MTTKGRSQSDQHCNCFRSKYGRRGGLGMGGGGGGAAECGVVMGWGGGGWLGREQGVNF